MKGGFSTPTTSARDDGVEQQVVRKSAMGRVGLNPIHLGIMVLKCAVAT